MTELIRLDKYLAEMGIGTRSQIKEMAKKGRVHVNGQTEKKTERKIDPGMDHVSVDGRHMTYVKTEYYMLNKPQGVVSATRDNLHQTVLELLEDKLRQDLFPVGRLDIDTEGLLLITNDGDLAHRLLSPKSHVDKVYYAKIDGQLPTNAISQLEEGMVLADGTKTLPAKLEITHNNQASAEVFLTIREGKFHQVKRMFEALSCRVTYLKRISMGSLHLDDTLAPGEYRLLTKKELEQLKGPNKC